MLRRVVAAVAEDIPAMDVPLVESGASPLEVFPELLIALKDLKDLKSINRLSDHRHDSSFLNTF